MLAAVGIGFADDALVLTALAGFLVLAFQLGIGTRLAGLRDPRGLGQGALLPLSIAIGVVAGGMALQQVRTAKAFVAHVALEWFLLQVRADMAGEVVDAGI